MLAIAQSLILLVTFLIALPGTFDYVTFMSRERTWILQIPFSLAFSCFVLFMVMVILRSGAQDLAPAGPRLAGRARMSLELTLMFVLFFGLSAIGLPIGFAMISSGIAFLALDGRDLGLVADQIMNNLYRSFVLLAVPLFIFAADVMNDGSISDRLLKFATLLVGRIRGGLVHVDIVLSVIFSGMSGSAIADAAGPGKLMIQLMLRSGRYAPGFAGAIIAASATIGPIIPPSIPMVLYALVANTSVGYLFLGGVIPGLLMAACLMAVVAVIARRRDFPVEPPLERGRGRPDPARRLPRAAAAGDPAGRHLLRRGDADRGRSGRRRLRAAAGDGLLPRALAARAARGADRLGAVDCGRRDGDRRRLPVQLHRLGRARADAARRLARHARHPAARLPARRSTCCSSCSAASSTRC